MSHGQSAPARGLLDPERIASWTHPGISAADIGGGTITYGIQGPETGPLVLYFHGWGDDFRVVLPLEYPLIDAGFRLLVVHRPGYAGTTLGGEVDGKKDSWRTAAGFARAAAGLLDHLYGSGKWEAAVVGTSGGAPTALAFAELHVRQTKALVIQAGVTQPWTDATLVPELFRDSYLTAFTQLGWAGDHVSQVIFGLLAKLRENFTDDDEKLRALTGSRLDEAKRDPAFTAVMSKILLEDSANMRGELNDVFKIFFAEAAYCQCESLGVRTLVLHDPEDKFVPFVHAENALHIPKAQLLPFHLAGHIIWLGPDARAMHEARVDFLRGP
jgi:2-hydroxy-6-oxonona-2,4-dienedioate hydrolase